MDTQVREQYSHMIDGTKKDFQDWLVGKLKSEIDGMRVIFTKKDGSERELDRKSTRLNSSHIPLSRMPSSA